MNNKKEKATRIFLIDDHPAVLQGLKELLAEESYIVCGEATSSGETFERIKSRNADMALLDISLGQENGLALIAGLHGLGIAVLIYSMHEDTDTIVKAFAHGANGYVTKQEMSANLLAAVSDIAAGRRHISPRVALSLANRAVPLPV